MIVCASETYRATYDHVTFEPATEQAATSTTPIGLTATCVLGATAHLVWTGIYGAEKYLIYRDGQLVGETTTNSYDDSGLSEATYSYTVSAVVASEEGEQSETATVEIVNIEKLTGTVIGTTGSWNNNSATTRTAVFDGNLTTYFDASQSNGAWVGLDLGASNEAMVTEIRFCPRKGYASRMNGGRFQGAATRAFTNAVTLYTITEDPTDATLSSVAIDNPTAFRYLRYIGPDGGNCNVAEVQFFGRKASAMGIHTIETSNLKPETSAVYDLGGRKVNKPTKGLYIKNGKKIVIR